MQRWRNALTQAANLSGFDSHVIRPESELTEEIANEVLERLDDTFQSDNKHLVGVEWRIKEIESLLHTGSAGVNVLGIWGIGGIGKTTIADAVFNRISRRFEGSYFAHNVRNAEENGRIKDLQKELLSQLLNNRNMRNVESQLKRLARKKVLIVFDDVNHPRQIESLIGRLDQLASGSRVIITPRDKQVLKNCWANQIYRMEELVYADAHKLFSQHAFRGAHLDASYTELTHKAIEYAQGVPLALEVLGRYLCKRSKEEWESAIRELEIIPHMELQEVLKVSYDSLDDSQKNVFLDIACFLEGEHRDEVISYFDASGFEAKIELSVPEGKSLITLDILHRIRMHDLLRDMGREVVRKEFTDHPEKRSRLWYRKDIYEVLKKNTGTEAIKGISLNMSEVDNEIQINPDTFLKMPKLRFLKFYGENKCMVSHLEGVPFAEVRYFEWSGYPLKTLNIHVENLVSLKMRRSKVEQLWDDSQGVKNLVYLKVIDLSESESLTKLPNFSLAQKLEILILRGCLSLIDTHSSIQYLNKLKVLDLQDCKSLTSPPTTIHSENLKELKLSGCSKLNNFPEISSSHLYHLDLTSVGIKELPSFIECLSNLRKLYIKNCSRLENISGSIFKLQFLKDIEVSSCSNLKRFPEIPSCNTDGSTGTEPLASSLLILRNCSSLQSLPSSLYMLKSSTSLLIYNCKNFKRLPDELGNLKSLWSLTVHGTAIRDQQESFGRLSSLDNLVLSNNNLERIPECLDRLSSIEFEFLDLFEKNLDRIPDYLRSFPTSLPSKLTDHGLRVYLGKFLKLDPNERSVIFKDGWMYQLFHGESWLWGGRITRWMRKSMYFPGNEIPKWFRYQSIGSSVTLKTPPADFFHNKILVGFAFCVAVAFPSPECFWHQSVKGGRDRNLYDVKCVLKYKSKGYEDYVLARIRNVVSDYVFLGSYAFDGRTRYVKSGFFSVGSVLFDERIGALNEVSFHIERSYGRCPRSNGQCRGCCEVKKCGIHLVYAQDSTESAEEEEEPHPKRPTYSSTP